MSEYLLELAFGPVQGFINAARRSRDLWAGSYLLSELARAAGKSLLDGDAHLIYPLATRVRRSDSNQDSNLSNVLLARVTLESDAAAANLIATAQRAARNALLEFAEQARGTWSDEGVDLDDHIWQRQIADAIETYGAWSRCDGDYREAYQRVKAALAARKHTRDFAPMFERAQADLGRGKPKSSLDGLRESVLPPKRTQFPAILGLSSGEQLDALGCIKRVLGRSSRFSASTRLAADHFTALPRLAAHSWLATLTPQESASLHAVYEPLVGHGLATRASGNANCYQDFAFDAGLLYAERLQGAMAAARTSGDDAVAKDLRALQTVRDALCSAPTEHSSRRGEPCPYVALVVADGDQMGAFIDRAQRAEQHEQISAAVASFADRVPALAREQRGHCIFAGGEDLTVMYPLCGVLKGARVLAEAFEASMSDIVAQLCGDGLSQRPTLRVGAAICHVLEPLSVIRQFGDAAEKFAKGGVGIERPGNALGLSLHIRAGHRVRARLRFDDQRGFDAMQRWMDAYDNGALPGGLAFDLRDTYLRARRSGLDNAVALVEWERVLAHTNQRGGGTALAPELRQALRARREALADESADTGVMALADELILARWLSARNYGDVNVRGGR
jgi:CRISPR-associated protein Cmr2